VKPTKRIKLTAQIVGKFASWKIGAMRVFLKGTTADTIAEQKMTEKRRFLLYAYDSNGCGYIRSTMNYEYTTGSHERQLADELAAKHGLRQGEGHIAVCDDKGCGIDKLDLQP
jgi:hypothetical protein